MEKLETEYLYAMKVLRKDVIINTDQIESTKIEKEILKSVWSYFKKIKVM